VVLGVSSRSSSERVCVKELWACELTRRVGVEFVSYCCVLSARLCEDVLQLKRGPLRVSMRGSSRSMKEAV
jgi:hypothetical protein